MDELKQWNFDSVFNALSNRNTRNVTGKNLKECSYRDILNDVFDVVTYYILISIRRPRPSRRCSTKADNHLIRAISKPISGDLLDNTSSRISVIQSAASQSGGTLRHSLHVCLVL